MTTIYIASASNAADLGLRALVDLSAVAAGHEYRVIGGHMIHILCHVHPTEEAKRATADADAGVAAEIADHPFVSKLGDHPGLGVALLPIALTNRVVRCRRAALTVLDTWQPQDRPPETIGWVRTAAEREPNPELRQTMLTFLHTHTQ